MIDMVKITSYRLKKNSLLEFIIKPNKYPKQHTKQVQQNVK